MKYKINQAFRKLRKLGYIAKQNWGCCSGCGWVMIKECYEDVEKVVFYHKQDLDYLKTNKLLYLSWNGDGKEITEVFKSVGLNVEWNGNSDVRILVKE